MGGGILHDVPLHEELGLAVPTTWEEFAANNEAVKAAGRAPVAPRTARDTGLLPGAEVWASPQDGAGHRFAA